MKANSRPVTKLRSLSKSRSKKEVPSAVQVWTTKKANATSVPAASSLISQESNQSSCWPRSRNSCSSPMATLSATKPKMSSFSPLGLLSGR